MRISRGVALGVLLAVCGTVTAQMPPQAHSPSVKLDISSQPLGDALNEFAKQAGLQVVLYSRISEGLMAPQVVGVLSPQSALQRLLDKTGLKFEYIDAGTVGIFATGEQDPLSSSRKPIADASATSSLRLAQAEAAATDTGSPTSTLRSEERTGTASAPNGAQGLQLEEIVVTATKRIQNIQDVPLSIAAITAEEIDRRGLVSAEDYLRGIPGVNHVAQEAGTSIIIRGIETSPNAQNAGSGTTVATYFGETPTTNSAGYTGNTNVDIKLVDIERVEVLRGPQGTAFGNSSLGGAVRTIPVSPKLDRFEGKVAAAYSVTSGSGGDNNMIQAVGNIPLVADRLAIRATAYRFEDSGFYRNVAGSDTAFRTAVASSGPQALAFTLDEDEVGSSQFTGGRVAALFRASDALTFTLTYLTQETEIDGQARSTTAGYDQTHLQLSPAHVIDGNGGGQSVTDIDLANATVEYDFGWANLLATYSHVKSGTTYSAPLPPNFTRPASTVLPSDHRENSGEIRLATKLEGAWNFLGGVYAERLEDEGLQDAYWYGDPARNNVCTGCGGLIYMGEVRNTRDLKQKAAFAEASWEFLQGFTLTGGVRAYDYERTGRRVSSGPLFGTSDMPLSADASGTTFRGNLSYQPSDSALLYAAWSEGFRLGSPQTGLPPGQCDLNLDGVVDGSSLTIEQTRNIQPDELENIELGSKLTLLERRLTIAADVFRIDWTGVPVRSSLPPPSCAPAFVANAGGAISEGVEFQANFHVTRPLRIDIGASRINARLSRDAPALGASKGARLPGSPKINANLAVQYEFAIGEHEAFVRTDSTYVGAFYGDLLQNPNTKAGDYVKVDATARVKIRNLNVDLFVRNLTNVDDFTFRGILDRGTLFGYRQRPRTIGLQIGYDFGTQ